VTFHHIHAGKELSTPQDWHPLHVRVALALGWKRVALTFPHDVGGISDGDLLPTVTSKAVYVGLPPWDEEKDPSHPGHNSQCVYAWEDEPCECGPRRHERLPLYDQNWEAAGPLMRFARSLFRGKGYWLDEKAEWCAVDEADRFVGRGSQPLEAICQLVVTLKANDALVPVVTK
jgi:hypothetical protein